MKEENQKLIPVKLKPREWQLIKFLRNSFTDGDLKLTVHAHEPIDIIIVEPRIHFDGNVKSADLFDNQIDK